MSREVLRRIRDQLETCADSLEEVASIYPGDPSGDINLEAYIYRLLIEYVEDNKWSEVIEDWKN